jgi:hypothetical protein
MAVLVAVGLAGSAESADLLGARGFVAQLYVKKTTDRHFRFSSPRVLTAELYDLVQAGGSALDYDPLCQCRDNDGLSAQILSVTGEGNQATARVRLHFAGDRALPSQHVTLRLTRSLAGWKLADLQSARLPSLKAWLQRRARG